MGDKGQRHILSQGLLPLTQRHQPGLRLKQLQAVAFFSACCSTNPMEGKSSSVAKIR